MLLGPSGRAPTYRRVPHSCVVCKGAVFDVSPATLQIFPSTAFKSCDLIRRMQTLGLSDSMRRSDSRLKSLFWPSIQSSSDVDYLGAQGYWVCAVIAAISLVVLVISGHPLLGGFVFLVFYLGGVGVRERSRYAAGCVLAPSVMELLVSPPPFLKCLFSPFLLSHLPPLF